MLAYRLENRPVLLIGGGNVASGRLYFLLEAGANVTLISPLETLHPATKHRIDTYASGNGKAGSIIYLPRDYLGEIDEIKVTDYNMVLTAIDNNPLSREVCDMARRSKIPVNVADVPPECDFYFGAQLRQGPLQIMVSTNGQGPKIAVLIKDLVLRSLPDNVEDAIEGVGKLRSDLRKRAPGVGGSLGQERMNWMIGVCDAWSLGDMGRLRDADVRKEILDRGWDDGRKVVRPGEVGKGGAKGWNSWFKVGRLAGVDASMLGIGIGGAAFGAAAASLTTLYFTRRMR